MGSLYGKVGPHGIGCKQPIKHKKWRACVSSPHAPCAASDLAHVPVHYTVAQQMRLHSVPVSAGHLQRPAAEGRGLPSSMAG